MTGVPSPAQKHHNEARQPVMVRTVAPTSQLSDAIAAQTQRPPRCPLAPNPTIAPQPDDPSAAPGSDRWWYYRRNWCGEEHAVDIQVLRSVGPWSAGCGREASIYHAYVRSILEAKHFIYIENQYFITGLGAAEPMDSDEDLDVESNPRSSDNGSMDSSSDSDSSDSPHASDASPANHADANTGPDIAKTSPKRQQAMQRWRKVQSMFQAQRPSVSNKIEEGCGIVPTAEIRETSDASHAGRHSGGSKPTSRTNSAHHKLGASPRRPTKSPALDEAELRLHFKTPKPISAGKKHPKLRDRLIRFMSTSHPTSPRTAKLSNTSAHGRSLSAHPSSTRIQAITDALQSTDAVRADAINFHRRQQSVGGALHRSLSPVISADEHSEASRDTHSQSDSQRHTRPQFGAEPQSQPEPLPQPKPQSPSQLHIRAPSATQRTTMNRHKHHRPDASQAAQGNISDATPAFIRTHAANRQESRNAEWSATPHPRSLSAYHSSAETTPQTQPSLRRLHSRDGSSRQRTAPAGFARELQLTGPGGRLTLDLLERTRQAADMAQGKPAPTNRPFHRARQTSASNFDDIVLRAAAVARACMMGTVDTAAMENLEVSAASPTATQSPDERGSEFPVFSAPEDLEDATGPNEAQEPEAAGLKPSGGANGTHEHATAPMQPPPKSQNADVPRPTPMLGSNITPVDASQPSTSQPKPRTSNGRSERKAFLSARNAIGDAIYHRIRLAILQQETFRVIVVLPILPAQEGDATNSVPMRAILDYQDRTIARGEYSLLQVSLHFQFARSTVCVRLRGLTKLCPVSLATTSLHHLPLTASCSGVPRCGLE